ncbi:MAG: hypothetical protein ABWX73_09335 [Marmoricola sp.]
MVSDVTLPRKAGQEQARCPDCFQGKQSEENIVMHSMLDLALAGQLDRDRSAIAPLRSNPFRRLIRSGAEA